jgi:polysaccharide pyruvyl transferase WcaK-like protein
VKAIAWRTDVLPPGIASFEDALDDGDDYVGTRLHAGIRALQRGNRATVVVIDNRAAELAADTGLPVIPRDPDEGSLELLTEPRQTRLHLPRQEIRAWLEETSAWLRR